MLRRFAIAMLALLAMSQGAAAFGAGEPLRREIYLHADEDGEMMLVMRFPLLFAFAGGLDGGDLPFARQEMTPDGPRHRIEQGQYDSDFSGFVDHVLKDYRFTVAGEEATPTLGIIGLVPTKGTAGPYPGYVGTIALLDTCTAFPGAEYIRDLEVIVQVYLVGAEADLPLTIEVVTPDVALPSGASVETVFGDYRGAQPREITREGLVPEPVTLDAGLWQKFTQWVR